MPQASSELAGEIAARIAHRIPRFAVFAYTSRRRSRERDNITHVTVALPAAAAVVVGGWHVVVNSPSRLHDAAGVREGRARAPSRKEERVRRFGG